MENIGTVFHKAVRASSDLAKFWEKLFLVSLIEAAGLFVQDDPWLQVAPNYQRQHLASHLSH